MLCGSKAILSHCVCVCVLVRNISIPSEKHHGELSLSLKICMVHTIAKTNQTCIQQDRSQSSKRCSEISRSGSKRSVCQHDEHQYFSNTTRFEKDESSRCQNDEKGKGCESDALDEGHEGNQA